MYSSFVLGGQTVLKFETAVFYWEVPCLGRSGSNSDTVSTFRHINEQKPTEGRGEGKVGPPFGQLEKRFFVVCP